MSRDELRKAAQDALDAMEKEWDTKLSKGNAYSFMKAARALRAALAKNANAAPQDQDSKMDEIRKTLKLGMNIGKALREGINEDIAKDAARYRMARFKGTISDKWQDSLDHWIALDAALAAMKEKP